MRNVKLDWKELSTEDEYNLLRRLINSAHIEMCEMEQYEIERILKYGWTISDENGRLHFSKKVKGIF